MKRFVALLALLVTCVAVQAQASFAPTEQSTQPVHVVSIQNVHEYKLPNGLQILLVPDDSKPVATVNITYRVGSRHEGMGETGSAHLLEHMLFKASGTFDKPWESMRALGLRYNGTTTADRTNYFASFASNDDLAAQRMDFMLGWLASMMTQARFTKADLDSEMTVVRNEFERSENEPGRVLGDRMRAAAFNFHGYGHSTLGARSDIENMPLESLYVFYRKYYRPDNATLIVAGRFDEAAVKTKIAQAFAPIAQPATPLPATYTVDAVQDGERSVSLRRIGGFGSTAVLYHMPAGNTMGSVAARVLAETIRQTSGPLARGLIAQQLAVTDWAYYNPLREPSYLVAGVGLPEKLADMTDEQFGFKAIGSAAALAKVLETYQPTDTEVNTARSFLLAEARDVLRDAEATSQALSSMVSLGDWRLLFALQNALEVVTTEEVQALAKSYLVASNRTAGTYLPAGEKDAAQLARAPAPKIPDATQFVAVRAEPTQAKTDLSKQKAAQTGTFSTFDITPASLAKRTEIAQLSVGGAPGLRLAVLPRAAKDDRVTAALRLRWGTAETLRGSGVMATMLGTMMMEGNDNLPPAQIKKMLQDMDAKITISTSAGALFANLEFPAQQTQAVLNLLSTLLREPAFDSKKLERTKDSMLASLQGIKSDPASLASNTLQRSYRPPSLYAPGDPREVRTFAQTEALMRVASAQDLHAHWQRFGSAQHGELVLAGPVQLGPVQSQLEKLWGDWKTSEPQEVWVHEKTTPVGEPLSVVRVADKANASYVAHIGLSMNELDTDYPALLVATQLLSRVGLWDRVREKEGLSYGVGAELYAPSFGQAASIAITASFAPKNRDKLRAAVRAVLEEKREKGFGVLEVSFAKTAILSRRAENLAQPGNAITNIANNLRLKRPLDFSDKFTVAYQQLDAAAVNAALKKYLDLNGLWEVVAGSFE